jgi:hypothetical protein
MKEKLTIKKEDISGFNWNYSPKNGYKVTVLRLDDGRRFWVDIKILSKKKKNEIEFLENEIVKSDIYI